MLFRSQVDTRLITVMSQLADQLSQNDRTDTAARLTEIMLQAYRILPKYAPKSEAVAADDSEAPPVALDAPSAPPAPPSGGGLVGPDGLIRGSRPPDNPPAGKIEIARR